MLAVDRFATILLDKAGKPARHAACFIGGTCPTRPWHAVRVSAYSETVNALTTAMCCIADAPLSAWRAGATSDSGE